MTGKTITHYKILEKLGEGGMGVVYKAEDLKLKRIVALKFLPSSIMASEAEKTRFSHEAQAAAALNHPNICTIYEIDEVDGQAFIAMEFIEGQSLKEKVASGMLQVASVIDIAMQVAEGLQAAHEKQITHRDIKPANIMLTTKGQVKIMDFGLAKLAGRSALTKEGTTLGTVAYMSPEQARGETVDHRADIWSFGVVLYEMITGQLPFKGEHDQAVLFLIMNENPAPPKNLCDHISEELQQIILRALEKKPEKRFQSSGEILQALQKRRGAATVFGAKALDFKTLLQFLKKPRVAVPVLAIVLLLAAAVYVPYQRLLKLQRARAMLPHIEKLAQEGKYFAAYELAIEAEKQLKNDTPLKHLFPAISDHLTATTQPAGARVYLKRFAPGAPENFPEKVYIGTTPIHDWRIARGDYKVSLEKEGYVPFERCVRIPRLLPPLLFFADNKIEAKLLEATKVPEGMVSVPGGKYHLVGWSLPTTAEAQLDDYFIDKYEVTNEQYRAFIKAGGYLKKPYWKYSLKKDGNVLSWEEARPYFTDRTGLPGPSSWVNQEFPEGKGNHPVTDITWYEAAYAEFVGKNLPTIFQWEKAARNGATDPFGMVMPWGLLFPPETIERRANFNGKALAAVDSYEFGISPYGCYNMAGNVKEWCLNEVADGYVTTGGSWEDPQYLFAYYGNFSGFYSSRALGFRCVRNAASATSDQGAMKINLAARTPSYSPVNEATFGNFLSHYQYDKAPLEAHADETGETEDWIREKVSFAGVQGDRIMAYLYLPKRAAKPFQCLNFIPPAPEFLGMRSTAEIAEYDLFPQIKSGRAVLAVVPKGGLERPREPGYRWPASHTVEYRELVAHFATKFSLGLDYLATRGDIDMNKLAYVAESVVGLKIIFPAVEPRYRSVILLGAGLWPSDAPPEANPINFAPYIKAPCLIVNGRHDELCTLETHVRPLYNLLRAPKQLALVDGGHAPPLEARATIINKWLDETLGPVRFE